VTQTNFQKATIPPIRERALHFHLSGIGGAAMAPLAGMLGESGHRVTGSDTGVYPPASTLLESLGIRWTNGFNAANLDPAPDIVVIGNALSRGNPEVEAVLDRKIPYRSLPQALEEFFLPGHDSLVVTGTHGKTTTTSMLSWILHHAGHRPNFLIGGVAENFGRSFGLGDGSEFVLEGDEYDSAFFDKAPKFLHYHPDEVIITSLEFDHADIYENLAAIELQFRRMVNLVPRRGKIVAWGESQTVCDVVEKAFCPVETYGFAPGLDWLAGDLEIVGGETRFRISHQGKEVARMSMALSGRHNVLNVLAAAAIAHGRGVSGEQIAAAMAEFRGVLRRLEVKGEPSGVLVVDDFAHHPTAIRVTIDAARHRWPGRKLWAVFEPRSNTMRRRIFEADLASALATADAAVLGAVNRASLLSDEERLSPERVLQAIREAGRGASGFNSAEEIAEYLASETCPGDLVLVMSNGSFDGLCGKLMGKLQERVTPAGKFKA
jgi:UDP-N-acetylmuramate: L-alanyl-gamma-D-glutamyl-meso-diaminopimelate ligase